jgi:hypothetical protein
MSNDDNIGIVMEYKHVAYNPLWGVLPGSSLAAICATMEENDWMLSHVVSIHAYESVAVFTRQKREELETEEEHRGDYL